MEQKIHERSLRFKVGFNYILQPGFVHRIRFSVTYFMDGAPKNPAQTNYSLHSLIRRIMFGVSSLSTGIGFSCRVAAHLVRYKFGSSAHWMSSIRVRCRRSNWLTAAAASRIVVTLLKITINGVVFVPVF